jgi:hypothetical protein
MEAVNGGMKLWLIFCKITGVLDKTKHNTEVYWIWEKEFWS